MKPGAKTMNRDKKIQRIVAYNMSCGQSASAAREYAEEMVEQGDSISIVCRFRDDFGNEEFLAWNFCCQAEMYGWKKTEEKDFVTKLVDNAFNEGRIDLDLFSGDVAYAKRLSRNCYSCCVLDSKDPFYNSVWGQITPDVARQCCEPVRQRIARGM
jgi:hypothetical protein